MESKHGIMFVTESGAEILIHIGLDTVNLNGKYFKFEFRNYLVTYNKCYTLPCKSQPSQKIPEYIVILQDFVVNRIKATAFAT